MTWLLANAVCVLILAVPAWLVGRYARRPALAHALWLLVLLKLLTPPLIRPELPWLAAPPSESTLPLPTATPKAVVTEPAADVEPTATTPQPLDPWTLLTGVWLAGAAVVLGRSLWLVTRFHSLLCHAEVAPDDLQREAEEVAQRLGMTWVPKVWLVPGPLPPMVWAVGSVRLLFPIGLLGRLDADGRRGLMAHELAHVRRRDHWVRWAEAAALALFWWFPVAWWARAEMQRQEELCCDALAAEATSPRTYAEAMLDVVDFLADAGHPVPALASTLSAAHSLRERLTRVLTGAAAPALGGPARMGLFALAVCGLPLMPLLVPAAPAVPAEDAVSRVAFTEDGRVVLAIVDGPSRPRRVEAFPTAVARVPANVLQLAVPQPVVSPDGRTVAVVVRDTLQLRDPTAVRFAARPVQLARFSADGRLAVAGGRQGASVWEVATRRLVARLDGHQGPVLDAAFAPRSRLLATAGADRTVRLYDARTFEVTGVLRGHAGPVSAVAFSPTGDRLAAAGGRVVTVWSVTRRAEVNNLLIGTGTVVMQRK
jgi:beta-lactamase regulating signal transducer with metallopeptidase domain